jgi:RNA polymerase sigma factor (sigma-70 family)
MPQGEDELIPTRATLIQRLKNWQDESSWQDFFETYWRFIYGVARKSGLTTAEAQDVVQETMVSVAKHIPSFKYDPAIGSFKAWLMNMTRWRITDQIRHRSSPHGRAGTGDYLPDGVSELDRVVDPTSETLNQIWDAEWEANLLEAALTRVKRRLDPQLYQIFDLYVNKNWAAEKVADAFQTSLSQVYVAKHRVVEMIRTEVQRLEKEAT